MTKPKHVLILDFYAISIRLKLQRSGANQIQMLSLQSTELVLKPAGNVHCFTRLSSFQEPTLLSLCSCKHKAHMM